VSETDDKTTPISPSILAAKARAADREAKEADEQTPRVPPVVEKIIESIEPEPEAPKSVERKETKELRAWALRHADRLIAFGLGATYVIWLIATARTLGFSRDEGFYFSASGEYERWFKLLLASPSQAMDRAAIDGIWAANHEHPSLMKSLFALSHMFLYERWKIFSDASTAFRFPGMVSMGLAIGVTYLFGARVYSRRAGIVGAIALGLMPNVFYHAHLACFDVPIMAMWITCVYVYWVAEKEGGLGWALACGLVYGLTLETKHNAWMLPAVFLPHALVVHGKAIASDTAKTARLPLPASLVAMATVGPLVFLALWPWLWNDTIPRLQEYVNFHVHHEYYNIEFLGRTYFGPPSPRSYMPVMIAATVPTTTLVLFAIGVGTRLRDLASRAIHALREELAPSPDKEADLLLVLSLAVPLSVFLLPRTPIFGGTKHWITAYPALAVFAGYGFDQVAARIEALTADRLDWEKRRWLIAVLGGLTLAAPFAITRHSHPFGLSAYVPFFGGTAGGADLGLNRQFWGFTTQSLDPWFQENTKPGDTVYIMDTAWPSWQRMIEEKRIPPWLRGVGSPAEAEIAIVHHEQHINEVDYNIWTEYGHVAPEYVLTHDGVPIISVYRRPRRAR
jgi:hypothetical protein